MIVVCDTNVLISAFLVPGSPPHRIVQAIVAGTLPHATSPDLISDLKLVLKRKLAIGEQQINRLTALLIDCSQMVYPSERINRIKADESDNRILECAVTANADYLISGDKRHVLPLKTIGKTIIISPREFISQVRLL